MGAGEWNLHDHISVCPGLDVEIGRRGQVNHDTSGQRMLAMERDTQILDWFLIDGNVLIVVPDLASGKVENEAIGIGDEARGRRDGGTDGDGDLQTIGRGGDVDFADGRLRGSRSDDNGLWVIRLLSENSGAKCGKQDAMKGSGRTRNQGVPLFGDYPHCNPERQTSRNCRSLRVRC